MALISKVAKFSIGKCCSIALIGLAFIFSLNAMAGQSCEVVLSNNFDNQPLIPKHVQLTIEHIRKAEKLVPRTADGMDVNFKDNSDLVIFFHPKDTDKIALSGFLNQHQTGKSSGRFDLKLRTAVEDAIIGLKLDEFGPKSLRPKSALVLNRGELLGFKSSYNPAGLYGGVGAVLKSKVKDRAIWTLGDSLEVGQEIINGRVKEDEINLVRGTFSRTWLSGIESVPESLRKPQFMEALILGDLQLSDVDHFVVEYESSATPLLGLGKPVFLVQGFSVNGNFQFKYKRIMNFGDDAPENLPPDQKLKIESAMNQYRGKGYTHPKIGLYPQ